VAAVTERRPKQVNKSLLTVLIAFLANLLIAIAKSVAAAITSSASMLAEAAHSWADAGNEIFLLIADRRSDRGPDSQHPKGHGREAYVWSMFAAFGLFTAGAVVSIWHGVRQLIEPEEATNYLVAYVVLAIAFVLEGISFIQAMTQSRRLAATQDRSVPSYVANTSNPTLRAVFAEDAAAPDRHHDRGHRRSAPPGHRISGPGRDWLNPGRRTAGSRRGLLDRPQPALLGRRGSPPRGPAAGAPPSCWHARTLTGSPICTWSSSVPVGCIWLPRST
jgi:Cation efflux family